MKYTSHGWRRLPRKTFGVLSMQIGLKCTKKPGLKSFHKACPKKIGHSIRVPMPIQPYKNASGQDTASLPLTKVTIWQIIRIITLNWKIFHAKFLKSVWKRVHILKNIAFNLITKFSSMFHAFWNFYNSLNFETQYCVY